MFNLKLNISRKEKKIIKKKKPLNFLLSNYKPSAWTEDIFWQRRLSVTSTNSSVVWHAATPREEETQGETSLSDLELF